MCKQLLVTIVFVIAYGIAPPATAGAPTDQVKETIDAVLAAVKESGADPGAGREKLRSIIYARFDYKNMARRILGRYWKKASTGDQARFVNLLTQLLTNTYLERIEAYTDERVDYVGEKIKKEKYAQVDTRIVTSSKEIPVDYRLELAGGEWKVYDVIVEAVSLVRNYRNTYQDIASKKGVNGLLEDMEQKVAETTLN